MKKRGSILPYIVIFIALALAVNWFYKKYSTYPSKLTQDTTASIYQYPYSKSWSMDNKKGLCAYAVKNCSLSSKITFTASEDWATIYTYYAKNMQVLGWSTNSSIITSIPTGILFTNGNNCEAELTPKRKGIFEFSPSTNGKYFFNVTCPS